MRAVAASVLALCIGCGASPDGQGAQDTTAAEAPPPQPVVVHEREAPAEDLPAVTPAPASSFSASAYQWDSTSVVTEPDGTVWTAGWFRGSINLAGFVLHSKGETDVFLSKTDASGKVVWVVAAGSPEDERNAKVSLMDDGSGNVAVDALTSGRIDCGAGALQQWGERTYFFCRYRKSDGALVDGASFPTAP